MMFVISLTYKMPIEAIEKYLPEHIAFLDKYYALNKFICSGRKNPRTGGVILANNMPKGDLDLIIDEDPFYKYEVADYEIIEFVPTKYDKRFELFAQDLGY